MVKPRASRPGSIEAFAVCRALAPHPALRPDSLRQLLGGGPEASQQGAGEAGAAAGERGVAEGAPGAGGGAGTDGPLSSDKQQQQGEAGEGGLRAAAVAVPFLACGDLHGLDAGLQCA